MQQSGYAKRSWELLTRQKGWIKPVLVMAAASLVPVAGALGVSGYALEWARLTAWGVDAAPKQKNVNVGTCIHSGFRAFVVALVWGLCLGVALGIVGAVVGFVPGALGSLLQGLVGICSFAIEIFCGVAIAVASVRCAIYEKISAGLRLDRIIEMIKRDTRGFMRLVGFTLVFALVMCVALSIVAIVVALAFVPIAISAGYGVDEYAIRMALAQSAGIAIVLLLVLGYGISIVGNAYSLIFYNAVALWMRQFDVPSWGKSEDPLPPEAGMGAQDDMAQAYGLPAVTQHGSESESAQHDEPAPEEGSGAAETGDIVSDVAPTIRFEPGPTQRLHREPDTRPEPEPDTQPESEPDTPWSSDAGSTTTGNSDVDELYKQLYDVMRRDDEE